MIWTEDIVAQLCEHFLLADPRTVKIAIVEGIGLDLATFPLFTPLARPILSLHAPPPLDLPDRRIDLHELVFEDEQGKLHKVWAGYASPVLAIKRQHSPQEKTP